MRGATLHKEAYLILSILFFPVFFLFSPAYTQANSYYYKKESNGVVYYTNIDPKSSSYKRVVNPWGTFRGTPKSKRGYLNKFKYSDKFDENITTTARWYGIDPLLIKAMIKVESNFNADAVSPKGAMGIMQLMPGTAERVGVADPFNPSENIEGGVRYFNKLLNMFNDVTLAIAGYNAGENAVKKYGYKIPPYSETIEYVEKVYAHYDYLKQTPTARNIKARVADRKDKNNSPKKKVKSFVYVETLKTETIVNNKGKSPRKSESGANKEAGEKKQTASAVKADSPQVTDALVASDSNGSYTVQIASYPDLDIARKMEQALLSKTYPAYIEKADLPGRGTWYRVRVGKFTTKEEASRYGRDIQTDEPEVDSILVTLN
ncbi:MAG: lytic transglycosylase domain-containing protein [Deltaproteobacteria bacterium]